MFLPKLGLSKRCLWFFLPLVAAGIILFLFIGGLHQTAIALAAPHALLPSYNHPEAGNVITIGVAADLSDGVDFIGWRQANAVQLAVDELNQGGGLDIGGVPYSVSIVLADSMCDPTQAITAAQTLLDAGVVALVGHSCTGASLAAQPLYAAAGIPMVSASATGPDLTDQGYTNTFRVINRDDTWARLMAKGFFSIYAMQTAAIVEMDGFYGNWASDTFSDTFTSLGGMITSRHTLTTTDAFTTTLTQIKAEGSHVIYFPYTDGGTAGLLAKAAYNLDMPDTLIGWNCLDGEKSQLTAYDAAAGSGSDMNHAVFSFPETGDMPGYEDFNAAYQAVGFPNYGDEAQSWGALAYDAANIILEAIDRADSLLPADIRDEIAATASFAGVARTYEGFDAKGDMIPQWGDVLRRMQGEWLYLQPEADMLPVFDFSRVDDFDTETLAPTWSWINESPDHWSLTEAPGFLRLVLQPDFTTMLVRPVPQGDFEIRTRLIFTPTTNFEMGGLVLYQDDGNLLLLGRAFCEFGYPGCVEGNGIYFDHIEDGALVGDNYGMRTASTGLAYLRIIRQGSFYTGYVSEDGQNWLLVGRHEVSSEVELDWMGLAIRGPIEQTEQTEQTSADFDFFWHSADFLTRALPIVIK